MSVNVVVAPNNDRISGETVTVPYVRDPKGVPAHASSES